MTKQVNLVHLEDAMIRAKQYVDDQATANVIRTETTLWSGYQIYPTTANTPISTQMVTATNAYQTMYGQTTGGIALSDRLDNYDEIEVGVNRVMANNGVSTNLANTTYTFPVSNIVDTVNNRYRLCSFEWYGDAFDATHRAYAFFGCQDNNKLGVHITLSDANDSWHITYVKGIKYVQGGGGGSLTPATTTTLGGVIVGSGLSVEADGTLSVDAGAGMTADLLWENGGVTNPSTITLTKSMEDYDMIMVTGLFVSENALVTSMTLPRDYVFGTTKIDISDDARYSRYTVTDWTTLTYHSHSAIAIQKVYGIKFGVPELTQADKDYIASKFDFQSYAGRWKKIGEWDLSSAPIQLTLDLSRYNAVALASGSTGSLTNSVVKVVDDWEVGEVISSYTADSGGNFSVLLTKNSDVSYTLSRNLTRTRAVLYGYEEYGLSDAAIDDIANRISVLPAISAIGRWEKIGEFDANTTNTVTGLSEYNFFAAALKSANGSNYRTYGLISAEDAKTQDMFMSDTSDGSRFGSVTIRAASDTITISQGSGIGKMVVYGYKETALSDSDVRRIAQEALIPAGGTTGQALTKASDADYDYAWLDPMPRVVQVVLNNTTGAITCTFSSPPTTKKVCRITGNGDEIAGTWSGDVFTPTTVTDTTENEWMVVIE